MMPIVPTTLVRITRFYLLSALGYLVLTLLLAVIAGSGMFPGLNPNLFWYAGVLGWVSLPVMGAFYQFFPTLQGQDLHMERLTLPQYAITNIGVLGMLGSLLIGSNTGLAIFTTVYAAGAWLLAFILVAGNLTPSKVTLTVRFFVTAVFYYLSGVTILALDNLGLTVIGRPVVSHLVLIGWAVMAIYGAQYIMVPMLQLKSLAWERLASIQYYVANLGLLGLAWGFLGGGVPVIAAGGAMEFLAIMLYLSVILRSLTAGPSRLAKTDLSVMFFMAGNGYLFLVAILGISNALFPLGLRTVHMNLAILGVFTNIIVGAIYHIMPFLVWWENYAGKVGLERVPLLKELFNEPFARKSFYVWNGALWVMVAGFLLGWNLLVALGAAVLLVLAATLLAQMIQLVASHRGSDVSRKQPNGGGALNPTAEGGV